MKMKDFFIALFIGALLLFSGCADKHYHENFYEYENQIIEENTYYDGALIFSEQFEVKKSDFVWNSLYNRFEFIIDNEEIIEEVYENGVVLATVFISEEAEDGSVYETQKTLSFSREFPFPAGSNTWYKETISADISLGAVGFFIEGLKENERNVLLDTYYFKVSIIWDATTKTKSQTRIPFK